MSEKVWLPVGAWFLTAMFFWGRGIFRGRTGDLIGGGAILAALCVFLWITAWSSGVFGLIGGILGAVGVATVIMSRWARPSGLLQKRNLAALGAGCIIVGGCLVLIA